MEPKAICLFSLSLSLSLSLYSTKILCTVNDSKEWGTVSTIVQRSNSAVVSSLLLFDLKCNCRLAFIDDEGVAAGSVAGRYRGWEAERAHSLSVPLASAGCWALLGALERACLRSIPLISGGCWALDGEPIVLPCYPLPLHPQGAGRYLGH